MPSAAVLLSAVKEARLGGGRGVRAGRKVGELAGWQPAWLSCSSPGITGCCFCSLLGSYNPLDCCIKTITWVFALFQMFYIASPLEEAKNNKEWRGGGGGVGGAWLSGKSVCHSWEIRCRCVKWWKSAWICGCSFCLSFCFFFFCGACLRTSWWETEWLWLAQPSNVRPLYTKFPCLSCHAIEHSSSLSHKKKP